MPRINVGSENVEGFDWKAAGYLTSIVSVLFLGAAAWLKQHPPWWFHPALVVGMVTSICGMAFRYKSHLDEKSEIKEAKQKADRQNGRTAAPRPRRRAA
jgi:hypothetical protein